MRQEYSKEYQEYLKSEAWRAKRFERLRIDNGKCVMCGRYVEGDDWQCHHLHYKTLGHEDALTDLCTVCRSCHRLIHNYYDRPGGLLSSNTTRR